MCSSLFPSPPPLGFVRDTTDTKPKVDAGLAACWPPAGLRALVISLFRGPVRARRGGGRGGKKKCVPGNSSGEARGTHTPTAIQDARGNLIASKQARRAHYFHEKYNDDLTTTFSPFRLSSPFFPVRFSSSPPSPFNLRLLKYLFYARGRLLFHGSQILASRLARTFGLGSSHNVNFYRPNES